MRNWALNRNAYPGRRFILNLRQKNTIRASKSCTSDIAIFHDFSPPPAGGGHQFLRALGTELQAREWRLSYNQLGPNTRACLFNSFNFDAGLLAALPKTTCRMVHRVDGPMSLYRGYDDGTDAKVMAVNRQFADATIFQSRFSKQANADLFDSWAEPVCIRNTPDPEMFYPNREKKSPSSPVKIIATSWSDNPNKGGDVYHWLAKHLDPTRYKFTFVGRLGTPLPNNIHHPPLPSDKLAKLLREHDIFITASMHDPCSNSVLEALACGLPVLYLKSGGHSELVGHAGLGFDQKDEIIHLLDKISAGIQHYRSMIDLPTLSAVTNQYLQAMGLPTHPEFKT